jgi:Zn-dependent protease with chaperone function
MSVAICLLLYSFAVAVLVPHVLARLTPTGVAPALGVAAWLTAIGSVLVAWAVAAVFLVADVVDNWSQPERVLSGCFAAVRHIASGSSGLFLQAGLVTLTTAAAGALGTVGWRLGRSLLSARRRTHRHAMQVRFVGRRVAGLDAVVLDAPERAAYCAAGRPDTIVVTSAALDALDDRHLGAVLAHERAHLTGRHHQIVAFTSAAAAILPRVELFTRGAQETARLLEMCADDAAARGYGPRTLLGALLALSGSAPATRGALAASGVDVLARAKRLAAPASTGARWRTGMLLAAVTVLVAAAALFTGVLAASDLALCNPLTG